MKTRRHRAWLTVVLAMATSCGGSAQPGDSNATATGREQAAKATRDMFASMDPGGPGCSVAVLSGSEIVFAEAFGAARVDGAQPMTPETVVDIGSTSKQFTATAVALLVLRGEVELDAPLSDYLDGYPDWADEVTVDQLVHHTSGIPDYIEMLADEGFDDADVTTDADAQRVLQAADSLDFAAGSAWEYSNSNYLLLGYLVGAVSGAPLPEFLATEVFEPLGLAMRMEPVANTANKAISYVRKGRKWVVADSRWEQVGDGGIQTTPTELVRWATQYWHPTIGTADGDIADLRFADAQAISNDEADGEYGFGIIRASNNEGEEIYFHDGAWAGFETAFLLNPAQKIALAATCTSPDVGPEPDDWDARLMQIWSDALS